MQARGPRIAILLLSAVLFWQSTARAQTDARPDGQAQVSGDCATVKRPADWSLQERWVWDRVCQGVEADLSKYAPGSTDPASDAAWPKERELQAKFLTTILTLEPYRSAVPAGGIHISYALFSGPIDLANSSLARELQLKNSRFLDAVDLERVESSGPLSLEGSRLAAGLKLSGAKLGGDLLLMDSDIGPHSDQPATDLKTVADFNDASIAGNVEASRAVIRGNMEFYGTHVAANAEFSDVDIKGKLTGVNVHVGGDLWLSNAISAGAVMFLGAKIQGDVYLTDAQISGQLNMSRADVGGGVWLDDARLSDAVKFTGMRVVGDLLLSGANVAGEIGLSRVQVSGDLFLDRAVASSTVTLQGAQIAGNAEFSGTSLSDDFTGDNMQVGRDLWLDGVEASGTVEFLGAHVQGDGYFSNSRFSSALKLSRAQVGGNLWLDGVEVSDDLTLEGTHVAGNLYLSTLDSSKSDGPRVSSDLDLGSSRYRREIRASYMQVGGTVKLNDIEARDLDFLGAQVGADIYFTGAHVAGAAKLNRMRIGHSLWMNTTGGGRQATFDGDVNLQGASIDGSARFTGMRVSGAMQMENLAVAEDMEMGASFEGYASVAEGEFSDVSLDGAHVGGTLRVRQGDFAGAVRMDDAEFRQNLEIGGQAVFHDGLELNRARVVGEVRIEAASFFKRERALDQETPVVLLMEGMQVGDSVLLGEKATFVGMVSLTYGHIARNLDLTDGEFMGIDLTGTVVGSEIRLGTPMHPNPTWQPPQMLTLRNVSAGALQDLPGATAWPGSLDLEGFTYGRLGGNQTTSGELAARPASDLTDWLEKQHRYSPQSYLQLADVLRAAGFPEKADSILFAGKWQETKEAPWYRQIWLCLEMVTTGFGLYPIVAVLWVLALVAAGYLVIRRDTRKEIAAFTWADKIIYSLDMLLPVVHLRKTNYDFEPTAPWRRYYLYFHRLTGFLLASVIIASFTHGTIELHG